MGTLVGEGDWDWVSVGSEVGGVVGVGVGNGLGVTVGARVLIVICDVSMVALAEGLKILFEIALVVNSAERFVFSIHSFWTSSMLSILTVKMTSNPVTFCSCTLTFVSPVFASSSVMLALKLLPVSPFTIELVVCASVCIVIGITNVFAKRR